MRNILIVFFGLVVVSLNGCAEKPKTEIVPKVKQVIHSILESKPPAISLQVFGEVRSGAYSDVRLTRTNHKNVPSQGIQDYTFTTCFTAGNNDQLVSEVFAEDVWKNYETDAPWLKGIRIKGVGDGEKIVWIKADVILKNGVTSGEAKVGQIVEIQLQYPTAETEGPTVEAKNNGEIFQHSVSLSGVYNEGKPVIGIGLICVRFPVVNKGNQNVTVNYKRGEYKKEINVKIVTE